MGSVVRQRAAWWSTFIAARTGLTVTLVLLTAFIVLAFPVQGASAASSSRSPGVASDQLLVAVDEVSFSRVMGETPLFQDDGSWQENPDYTDSAAATWEPTSEPTWEDSGETWEPAPGEATEYLESTPEWDESYVEPTAQTGDGQTWEEPAYTEDTSYSVQPVASDPNWRNVHWAQGPGQIQGTWKEIVVSISDQYMWAYEGGELVTSSLVSTGTAEVPATVTPIGYHSIIAKYDKQTMEGTISGEYYRVEDVPYVMYFDDLGNALHGTYWHNNFGTPMSHGCVNLPMDIAAFVYEWASYGTAVTVIS